MNDTTENSTPEEPIGEQVKHRMADLVGALRGKKDDDDAIASAPATGAAPTA